MVKRLGLGKRKRFPQAEASQAPDRITAAEALAHIMGFRSVLNFGLHSVPQKLSQLGRPDSKGSTINYLNSTNLVCFQHVL